MPSKKIIHQKQVPESLAKIILDHFGVLIKSVLQKLFGRSHSLFRAEVAGGASLAPLTSRGEANQQRREMLNYKS